MPLHLLDLPSELVAAVAERASHSDVLRLRLTCSTLAKICDFPLQDRRQTLYLHPKSICYAIDLCALPAWNKDITEAIILGNVTSSMRTREPSHNPDFRLDYHPWSQFPPTADGERILDYNQITEAEYKSFEENYASLIQGLQSLPRLRTIRYAARATKPGFCAVSDDTVIRHGRSRDTWQTSFGSVGQPPMYWALRTVWWSDAEVFTALVSSLRNTIETIDIQQPMPAIKKYADGLIRGATVDRQKALWRNIEFGTNLTRLSTVGSGLIDWQEFMENLTQHAPGLQTLEITVNTVVDEENMNFRQATDARHHDRSQFWEEETGRWYKVNPRNLAGGSKLHTLNIRCSAKYPYSLREHQFVDLLLDHASSLRHVVFDNVTFFHAVIEGFPGPSRARVNVVEGLKSIIASMRDGLNLESAVFRVPRIGCDEKCGFAVTGEHTLACGAYPALNTWFDVTVLEKLAAELKVEPEEEYWDFGQAVMRRPATEFDKTARS